MMAEHMFQVDRPRVEIRPDNSKYPANLWVETIHKPRIRRRSRAGRAPNTELITQCQFDHFRDRPVRFLRLLLNPGEE